jgi:HNH endonuclease
MPERQKRKPLSNRVRFEVFKRDKFTCQYCGRKAPDVLLQLDHIVAVANGGKNDILNLVTSCFDCNSGKSSKALDDTSAVHVQRQQLEMLEERRAQLEMLIRWQSQLSDFKDATHEDICSVINKRLTGRCLNEQGRGTVRKLLSKYGYETLRPLVSKALDEHLAFGTDGNATEDSVNEVLEYLRRFARVEKASEMNPYAKDTAYACGILRNRLDNWYPSEAGRWIESALSWGATPHEVNTVARSCSSFSNFRTRISSLIGELKADSTTPP